MGFASKVALAANLVDPRKHIGLNLGAHELRDLAAIKRDFLDQLGRDGLQRDISHKEHSLNTIIELLVHAGHLVFVLEIGDGAQLSGAQVVVRLPVH